MKKVSITKKISITTIGLIAMLMLLAAPVYAGEDGVGKATDSEKGGMTSADEMTGPDAIQASSLMDREVQDAEGNTIGMVTDTMAGPDGNVEYILLSKGDDFLGLGEKNLVPVPVSKVDTGNIGEDQEALTLSLSKEELENAPSFNEEEWQAFRQGEKQQEVRGYYGMEDAVPSEQDQMMNEKTGESYEMDEKATEGKGEMDTY